MKKLMSWLLAMLILLQAAAQKDSLPAPPYKRFPTPPPFKILLADSVSFFAKDDLPNKRALLMMVFSPDCEHCKHETEDIIRHIDEFKKITIVMATPSPLEKMKEFITLFGLERFPNITVGRDETFMLPVFYNMRNFPFLAFYSKNGDLIDTFEGSMSAEKILAKFAD